MLTNIKKYIGTTIISLLCLVIGFGIGAPKISHTTTELNEEYELINIELSDKELEAKIINENVNKATSKVEELKKSIKQ